MCVTTMSAPIGQSLNDQAIRSLSDFICSMVYTITHLQEHIKQNKKIYEDTEKTTITNLESGNQVHLGNDN